MVGETTRTILGIDPGTNIMGYGVLNVCGQSTKLVTMGIITPGKYAGHYDKLKYIFNRVLSVIDEYQPCEVALEAPFYGKNVQSMLKLGRAQGVAMAAALYRESPIFEYAPLKVKQALTGMGKASKDQVAWFLQRMYGITDLPKALDATDAVAVAFCHWLQSGRPHQQKEFKNWEEFVRKNPGRVK